MFVGVLCIAVFAVSAGVAVKSCSCLLQSVRMELSEWIVSGYVTAEWLVKCAINQQENVCPVADLALLASAAKSVSSVHS